MVDIQRKHVELTAIDCPYGWRCPSFILRKYDEQRRLFEKPLYETDAKCYICRGLMRREFQQFITIRCPPWIVDKDAALKMLNALAKRLTDIANLLHLKIGIVIAVGKVEFGDGNLEVRREFPHIHILVGAKERIGNLRIPMKQRIKNLVKFRQWLEDFYSEVFGGICDKCIYIKWIRYDEKKRGNNSVHGKGKFKLRTYLFKQLITKQYEPIIVGIHIKRVNKTPSTDKETPQNPYTIYSIRVYDNCCVFSSGGMGGYWGASARSDGGSDEPRIDRLVLEALVGSLYGGLVERYVYGDLRVDPYLLPVVKDALKKLKRDMSMGSFDAHNVVRSIYNMYLLIDTWNRVAATNKPVAPENLRDNVVYEYVENYGPRLEMLVSSLLDLYELSKNHVANILKGIAFSLRSKLEKVLDGSYKALGVDAMWILSTSVRFQIISKKKIRKLVRDLQYIENVIDADARAAALSMARVGRDISKYIEYSWKRLKRLMRIDTGDKRGVRYGSRGSRKLQFVVAVKSLIKQIRLFESMMKEMEGLGNIQNLDPDEFAFNAKELLQDASPCFLFAGRIVCVNVSDIARVVGEAKELVKYAKSFCRFCLGIKVKSSVNPCWSDDDKCLERFCGLYNELLGMVNGYRELLKRLRKRLRGRAKMRKRRYRKRLKKLIYKLSKIRSLSEFIYGKKEDPFTRALRAFSSWLGRRGYRLIQGYSGNPDNIPQREAISAKLGDSIEIVYHIEDWINKMLTADSKKS